MKQRTSIDIDEATRDKVEIIRQKLGVTMNKQIHFGLELYFAQHKNLIDKKKK